MFEFDEYEEVLKRNKPNPIYTKDMSAKEAKERADAFLQAKENEDFKFIMSRIIDAANHGDYKLTINREYQVTLSSFIKGKLEQLGYTVEVKSIQDIYQIVISWEGEKEYGQ